MDQYIENAYHAGALICIQIDGNRKFGNDILKGDPHKMSQNGSILLELLERKNFILVNSSEKCKGRIPNQPVKGVSWTI